MPALLGSLRAAALFLSTVVFLLGVVGPSDAHLGGDECGLLGGNLIGGECQLSVAVGASDAQHGGAFTLNQSLRITGTGRIAVPVASGGNTLTLIINGDFIMDVPTVAGGAQITGDVLTSNGIGATINIVATGRIILNGNGATGALISSNQSASSCSGGRGGNINLSADGNAAVGNGARVTSIARCSGGEISIVAGLTIDVDGLASSTGRASVAAGGPITLTAGCTLTIGDTGTVTSEGRHPGADLIHLEGGCAVLIRGRVASSGQRDQEGTPKNRCHAPDRPYKPDFSGACVEVWSGGPLTIESNSPHRGEVGADTFGPQATGCCSSWIDLFARGNINIVGDRRPRSRCMQINSCSVLEGSSRSSRPRAAFRPVDSPFNPTGSTPAAS